MAHACFIFDYFTHTKNNFGKLLFYLREFQEEFEDFYVFARGRGALVGGLSR